MMIDNPSYRASSGDSVRKMLTAANQMGQLGDRIANYLRKGIVELFA
jgi:hypothetical protein